MINIKFNLKKGQKVWICIEDLKKEFRNNPDEPYERILNPGEFPLEATYNIKPDIKEKMNYLFNNIMNNYKENNYELIIKYDDEFHYKREWTEVIIKDVINNNVYFEPIYDDITEKIFNNEYKAIHRIFFKKDNKFIRIVDNSKEYYIN